MNLHLHFFFKSKKWEKEVSVFTHLNIFRVFLLHFVALNIPFRFHNTPKLPVYTVFCCVISHASISAFLANSCYALNGTISYDLNISESKSAITDIIYSVMFCCHVLRCWNRIRFMQINDLSLYLQGNRHANLEWVRWHEETRSAQLCKLLVLLSFMDSFVTSHNVFSLPTCVSVQSVRNIPLKHLQT